MTGSENNLSLDASPSSLAGGKWAGFRSRRLRWLRDVVLANEDRFFSLFEKDGEGTHKNPAQENKSFIKNRGSSAISPPPRLRSRR